MLVTGSFKLFFEIIMGMYYPLAARDVVGELEYYQCIIPRNNY